MAKKGIHPKVQTVKYVMSDGAIEIVSTYDKNKTFTLDRSIKNHAAWKGADSNFVNVDAGNIALFAEKFGLISLDGK